MRKLFILLLVSVCILSLRAERVNIHTAQQIAESLIAAKITLRTSVSEELSLAYAAYAGGTSSALRSTPVSADADFYIFNVGKDAGFVIVAGEDRIRPVLGYADKGHFDEVNMPDNMKSWLRHYQEEIGYVVAKNDMAAASITEEWNSLLKSSANVTPKVLLRTAVWGQDDPFNRKCPAINGKQAVTGCVATAQAIVMQYYQYPKRAVGGVSSYMGIPITYDEYDWDNILPEYKEAQLGYAPYYTGYQADCMANLIWHCGANVSMAYGVEESSASLASSAAALQNVFGYSKQIRYISKLAPSGGDAYSWTDWMNILRGELDNNRLVLYDGQTEEKIDPFNGRGHAFVCDGYADGDLFHINWGWSGYLNGYFLLTTLDPYGDNKGYSERPGMIINIKPDDESENVADLYLGQSVQCAYLPFTINQPVIAYFTYANKGNVPFEGYANFVIVDGKDNSIKKILQEQNEPISVGIESDQTIDYPCLLRFTEPLPADYYVMAAYSSDGKDWKLLQGLTPDIASKLSWQGPVAEGSISYKVELDCRGGGLKLDMPDKVEYNQPLTLTLSANSGYKLPAKDRLSIQMARIDMSGYAASDEIHSNHCYILDLSDAQTAKITIPCVTGNIWIAAEGIQLDTQDDASLQFLSYDVAGVVSNIQLMQNEQSYTIELPDNTPDRTEISLNAVAKQNEATVEITNAFLSDGKATARVKVVAGDGITSITYEVHFIAKQSSEIISGVLKYQIAGENVVRVTAPNAPSPGAWTVTDCVIPETIELNNETYRVTGLGTEAFANCRRLTSITLPSGLNAIGERAFAGCSGSLKSIHCQNPEPAAFPLLFFHATMDERANSPSVYDCILYVPAGSKDRYVQAEGWKDFGGIMVEGEVIEPVVGEVTDSTTIVVWNTFEQATGYILKVYENAEKTKLKVEYKFDADGQLLRSSTFAFNIEELLPGHTYYIETLAIREGFFVTPIILSQNTVEVKTSNTATGIADIDDNELTLYGSNGCIHISSVVTVAVKIYDLSGKCVWDKIVEGYEQIRLPRKAYVVIVNDMNNKSSIKKQIVII